MKKQKRLITWIAGALLMLLSISSWATNPTYSCKLTNAVQTSCNVWEFDVTIVRTGAAVFNLAQWQLGILMNPAIIPAGGVIDVAPVPGTSQINPLAIPGTDQFGYDVTKNVILVTPTPPSIAAQTVILNSPAVRLYRIRVACSKAFVTGTSPNPTWNFLLPNGYQTKFFAFVAGTNVDITVPASHTLVAPYNPVFASMPDPLAQTITVDGPSYCNIPGGGNVIGLANTEAGYTYYMYNNGVAVTGLGGVIFGNGGPATFGTLATGNGHVITVKSPSCSGTIDMTGPITLNAVNPATPSVAITALPGTTVSAGTSVTYSASPTNAGVTPTYQWYVNGVSVDLEVNPTFTYVPVDGDIVTVDMSIDPLACSSPSLVTSNSITMIVLPFIAPPTAFNVTGGGSYCQGTSGALVGLDNSELGVNYTLFKDATAQVPLVPGTGSAISFGNQQFGTYTVSGTNGGGTTVMTGSVLVSETPSVPISVSIVSDVNNICDGTSATFTATPLGDLAPTYQWYKNSLPVGLDQATYSYVPANGDQVYVKITSGTLCAAPNPATSNTVTMIVSPAGPASVSITASANPSCGTASVTFTATPVNGGVPTYQWYVNTLPVGTGLAAYSYVPTSGDEIYVTMGSSLPCATGSPATSNTITMSVTVPAVVSVSIAANSNPICQYTPVTFTATPVNGGTPTYQWYLNSVAVGSGLATFTNIDPGNNDQVYVVMTSSLGCTTGSPATSSTTTMVVYQAPAPSISGPANVCVNVPGNVYTTEPGMSAYTWTVVNGGGIVTAGGTATDNTITITWPNPGLHTLSVNYSNANLCRASNPSLYSPTIYALPVPTISGLTPAGVGTTQVYTTEAGMTNYQWVVSAGGSITSGGTPTSNTVSVLWNTAGAQSVSVNYTNANNCTATAATVYPVTVISIPPAAGAITGTATVCQGSNGVAYSVAPVPNATGYVWTLPTGATIATGANTNSITVNYSYTAVSGNITVYGTNIFGNGAPSPNFAVTVNAAAVPTITGPATPCLNTTVVYTSQAGMTNYIWTVSAGGSVTAGGTVTSSTVTVHWTATGAQTVSVNYNNANGCNAATATVYNVNVNPLPVVTITGPTSACVNSVGNVYTTQAGMTGYTWTIAGGTITAGAGTNAITVTWNTVGAQNVSVNYANGNGCTAAAATVYNVTVNALPTPSITGPATPCSNAPGVVYTTQAGNTNYLWTVSAGGSITTGGSVNDNTVTILWTGAGAQTVGVNYTNPGNCTAVTPATYGVTVQQSSTPVLTGPTEACSDGAPVVYYTQSGQTNYQWAVSPGNTVIAGGTPTTQSITIQWNATGAQWVSVNYNNAGGCSAGTPTQLNVNVSVTPGAAGSINGPAVVCAGATDIGYDVGAIANATSYVWTVPAGVVITSGAGTNAITVDYGTTAVSGNIAVHGTNNCGDGNAYSKTITVDPLPAAAGEITGESTVCQGQIGVVYSVLPIANATTYEWTIPVGANIITGAGTNSIVVDYSRIAESGMVMVYGLNSCGEGAMASLEITVNLIPETPVITRNVNTLTSSISEGNQWYKDGTLLVGATAQTYDVTATGWYWAVVTLDGCPSDTSNHIYVIYDGITTTTTGKFELSPVPSNGLFVATMSWPSAANFTIRVYNNIGSQVFEMKDVQVNGSTKQVIDMQKVPSGMYTVVFTTGNNRVIRKMVINRD
jgi:hypothetical protein